jgi:hypothetical protein
MMTGEPFQPSEPSPSKRISDFPILVKYHLREVDYIFWGPGLPRPDSRAINAVNRFTTKRPDLLENW